MGQVSGTAGLLVLVAGTVMIHGAVLAACTCSSFLPHCEPGDGGGSTLGLGGFGGIASSILVAEPGRR